MQADSHSSDQTQELINLIESSNEKFDTAINAATSQAFNLGCSVGLLPGALILVLTFLFSHGSLAALMIATLLVTISLLALANLVAYIARARSIVRIYNNVVLPEITAGLQLIGQSRSDFERVAAEILPQGAGLRVFLDSSPSQE